MERSFSRIRKKEISRLLLWFLSSCQMSTNETLLRNLKRLQSCTKPLRSILNFTILSLMIAFSVSKSSMIDLAQNQQERKDLVILRVRVMWEHQTKNEAVVQVLNLEVRTQV